MSRFLRAWLVLAVFPAMSAAASGGKDPRVETSVVASSPRPAMAEEIASLNDALHRMARDIGRWAYTEHHVMRDDKGRVKQEALVRFDPSKPYAEQWTPLKIGGKEPSDRERTRYRRRGEKREPAGMGLVSPTASDRLGPSLGEVIELGRSTIASETATHYVFEVPLRKTGNSRFPPEKFQVWMRLRKEGALLENITVRLRESFRAKIIVNIKSGEGSLDFAVVDPKHPPTLVSIEGGAEASILFVKVGTSMTLRRTELKRVKPFDERFDVQIGTLKSIDF